MIMPILMMLMMHLPNLFSKDSNHKDIFQVDKINTYADTPNGDENEKIKELRELSVSTSYGRGVYNAIVLPSPQDQLLSSGFFFQLEMI